MPHGAVGPESGVCAVTGMDVCLWGSLVPSREPQGLSHSLRPRLPQAHSGASCAVTDVGELLAWEEATAQVAGTCQRSRALRRPQPEPRTPQNLLQSLSWGFRPRPGCRLLRRCGPQATSGLSCFSPRLATCHSLGLNGRILPSTPQEVGRAPSPPPHCGPPRPRLGASEASVLLGWDAGFTLVSCLGLLLVPAAGQWSFAGLSSSQEAFQSLDWLN